MSLFEMFGQVKDTRKSIGLRHQLQEFLTIVTLSIMSGYNSLQSMATFFKSNEETLIELFNLKHGTPSYTQTRTILKDLDYDSLYEAFEEWIISHSPIEKDDWVSGDGKALRSTLEDSQGGKQSR